MSRPDDPNAFGALPLALIPLALLSACATPAGGGVTAETLSGSAWTITAIDGAAPVSSRAALRFDRGRLGMTAGCNGMGGAWKIAGGRLVGGPYASTMMYCDGLMEQERALAHLLEEQPQVTIAGNALTLRSASHSATATRVP